MTGEDFPEDLPKGDGCGWIWSMKSESLTKRRVAGWMIRCFWILWIFTGQAFRCMNSGGYRISRWRFKTPVFVMKYF